MRLCQSFLSYVISENGNGVNEEVMVIRLPNIQSSQEMKREFRTRA